MSSALRRWVNRVVGLVDARLVRASDVSQMRATVNDLVAVVDRLQARTAELEAGRLAVLGAGPSLLEEVQLARRDLGTLGMQLRHGLRESEDYVLDQLRVQFERFIAPRLEKLQIVTHHPVALESNDHKFPRGTRTDNTRHPRFVRRCRQLFGRAIDHLDLGCAGGGLVWDFILGGHQSYGVEGSDYCLINQRALWRVLADNLFTADVTKPFHFVGGGRQRHRFEVITAWELLEHIGRADLPGFFANLRENLVDEGIFVASVAQFVDEDPVRGVAWHVTVEPREWWQEQFEEAGFNLVDGVFDIADHVRGSGNPSADDWDAATQPTLGFHLTARRR